MAVDSVQQIPQLGGGAVFVDQPDLNTGTYLVQLADGRQALIRKRRTKRLRLIHQALAKDDSEQLAALRDAALNSDNSPEETMPPCVFRFREAVSNWLPQDCIASSIWLPQRDESSPGEGGTDRSAQPHIDYPSHSVSCSRFADAGHAKDVSVWEAGCDATHAAKQHMAHPCLDAATHLPNAMLRNAADGLPGQTNSPHHSTGQHGAAAAWGQTPVAREQTTAVSKRPAGFPPELQVSKEDELLLKAEEKGVSKFSASCTVEPWLSKHCSMLGFDVVKQAVKQRIQTLQQQPP